MLLLKSDSSAYDFNVQNDKLVVRSGRIITIITKKLLSPHQDKIQAVLSRLLLPTPLKEALFFSNTIRLQWMLNDLHCISFNRGDLMGPPLLTVWK
jgi:hypothetical protein